MTAATSPAAMKTGPGLSVADVQRLRKDFPILEREINGVPLAYLDNAASAQKPRQVIDAVADYYRQHHANVHRGVHTLSQEATSAYEEAREKVRRHINAASLSEIVFVRGTTEAIYLVAQSFARPRLSAGDEILISWMEHHSNIVPWQLVCQQTGALLRVAPMNDQGDIRMDEFERLLSDRTRMVAVGHVSNALGTVNPLSRIIELAHQRDVPVVVDGAQALPHMSVDVADLDCDFYAFSGHKMFGPTGIGVLYGKEALLDAMPPYQGGGEMILKVSFEGTEYNRLPFKFEAGTPNIAGAVGLGATIDYINSVGLEMIGAYEHGLLEYATEVIGDVPGVRIIGTAAEKTAVVSFVMEGIHAHDIGTIVDSRGIAVRTGHHCAMPIMDYFGVPATARASMAFYNTPEEIDRLAEALRYARKFFD